MKRGDVIGIIGIIASMIGHICRHLLQNSCFTFICKLIHISFLQKNMIFFCFMETTCNDDKIKQTNVTNAELYMRHGKYYILLLSRERWF